MLADVLCQSTAIPSFSEHTASLFKLMQFFMMNFYLEIDDRHSSTCKMMKGYLRVDA